MGVDYRTFAIRDSARAGKKLIRLGNVAAPERGSMDDAAYEKKLEAVKEAFGNLVAKQMIWWKAGPDEVQPATKEGDDAITVLSDVWLTDGRHVNSAMKKEGHASAVAEYESELAHNILTAESDEKKKESYKELEEALRESQKEKEKQAKEEKKRRREQRKAEEASEPLGILGWLVIGSFLLLVVGALTNFGQRKNKKVNLNRKRGFFEG